MEESSSNRWEKEKLLLPNNFSFSQCVVYLTWAWNAQWGIVITHCPPVSVRRPSVHNFLVNTQASTNINQSAANLVKMCMTIGSRMSFYNGTNQTRTVRVICPWIRKFAIFVNTLTSSNIEQSVPNLATIYMLIRSRMSLIMCQIEPEHSELYALEFGKLLNMTLFTLLSSTNIDQSAPNLVKMYVIIRSGMRLIMDLIGPELSKLSALGLEHLPYLTLFTL